jgi:hypothetical protein
MGGRRSCGARRTLRTCRACVTFWACRPGRTCRTSRSSWAGVALRTSCTGCPCGTCCPLEIDISAPCGAGIEPKARTRPLMGGRWTSGTGWALRTRCSCQAGIPLWSCWPGRTLRTSWSLRSSLSELDHGFGPGDTLQEQLAVSDIYGEFSGSELRRAGHPAGHGGAFYQNGVCHD